MKELVEIIAKSLVDYPEQVVVTETEDADTVTIQLTVAPEDMGKVSVTEKPEETMAG